MTKKILLSPPHMGKKEQAYIHEAFENNWIAPLGPNVDAFEHGLEDYLKENVHVAALSSGTAAIHLALLLADVKQGDEVLCQSFTFAASVNPVLYLNATPVFIDSEEQSWNMCPELLEKAIKNRIKKGKKPKALIIVHLYGMPAKLKEILEIAHNYEIPLIEDAAEALGSTYSSRQCGTFGDFGILSFNGNKIITTSGGGGLICKNDKTKEKAIFLATQARDNAPHYQHSEIGYNYRMSNIVAGIGRGQLEVLNKRVKKRRAIHDLYRDTLSSIEEISFQKESVDVSSNRWLTCILTASYKQREKIRVYLGSKLIESRPLWKPMHLQPVFKEFPAFVNDISESYFNKGLCLPSGSRLSKTDVTRICECIKTCYGDK